ncbi:MAG TPA: ArsA-related P-loop ATPase [Streptosporangiaceae bacterium]|nr:ArsA-related P-loop ATPase [Streptosporangiaceae bacterium]
MTARDTDWEGVRLHVVTGKGGTGKTTVAAALALALAADGGTVLLMEVEGRQGIAQLFDRPPLPYEERKVAVAPGAPGVPGGDVYALAADPESALIEYLEMFYNLRHAGRALTRLGVVDFATTIAPGLRDVLLTGKAAEGARRKAGSRFKYQAVVLDAPPTGRIGQFLNVAGEISGLARVGPIRGHADTVQSVIASPQTAIHFVTLLEEMPVQETLDGLAELRGLPQGGLQPGAEPGGAGPGGVQPGGSQPGGIQPAGVQPWLFHPGGIMINMVPPVDLPADQLTALAAGRADQDELALGLKAAGLDEPAGAEAGLAASLADELAEHARGALAQREQRERLARAGQPCYELPLIPEGMDLAGLYRLAAALREQGAA